MIGIDDTPKQETPLRKTKYLLIPLEITISRPCVLHNLIRVMADPAVINLLTKIMLPQLSTYNPTAPDGNSNCVVDELLNSATG